LSSKSNVTGQRGGRTWWTAFPAQQDRGNIALQWPRSHQSRWQSW
jgi:hypothetical protein